jgi:deoxyribodipyrimidine photo-lyase
MDGALVLRHGDPAVVVPALVAELGIKTVHASADAGPYGRERDTRLASTLAGRNVELVCTGSPYAVGPGLITKADGTPYRVFTPFYKAWQARGWPAPAASPAVTWVRGIDSEPWPTEPDLAQLQLDPVGEAAAWRRWQAFRDGPLADYANDRNRADLAGTSGLSAHLKYGEIHPRSLLADLANHQGRGPDVFRSELAWREFYADVLWHNPASAREYLRPEWADMTYDNPLKTPGQERLQAWEEGRTGFPFVDAGLRQLRATGWMHNRVRMVVASFFLKDLHLEWQLGARHFMRWLCDGDLASNNHGWQWVAGSGTDAAPYFRVFNPISQGLKFDPDGNYVRRWLPELQHLAGAAAHEPWQAPDGYAHGYPQRIVDHAVERIESLARYATLRAADPA